MLTGKDLLAKVKELGDVSKSDLVKSCGYVSKKKGRGNSCLLRPHPPEPMGEENGKMVASPRGKPS